MELIYSALLLHKLGKEVNEENVKSIVVAAGSKVDESKIKSLVASLKGVDIAKELENASLVAAMPTSGNDSGKAPEKKEEKPKEEKKEATAEGLSALFG
ncbi:MAG: 50S ribosomal protein L12 [Candidatus Pacearchaeota archaeon]|jgi:large subunit ribosomal protein L12|nr:50S ribosomal protein P1 [Candidatus Pacearchaeota archaeon]MDP7520732.1 50S ribosomal protein L12 [Candidatus Pacearchaeota archaeon]|tara:strand:+ start:762 stop:1058 length:297 start_codon:yes stop_codon:yes gene_type:complete